jgi:hypothetical protein
MSRDFESTILLKIFESIDNAPLELADEWFPLRRESKLEMLTTAVSAQPCECNELSHRLLDAFRRGDRPCADLHQPFKASVRYRANFAVRIAQFSVRGRHDDWSIAL